MSWWTRFWVGFCVLYGFMWFGMAAFAIWLEKQS